MNCRGQSSSYSFYRWNTGHGESQVTGPVTRVGGVGRDKALSTLSSWPCRQTLFPSLRGRRCSEYYRPAFAKRQLKLHRKSGSCSLELHSPNRISAGSEGNQGGGRSHCLGLPLPIRRPQKYSHYLQGHRELWYGTYLPTRWFLRKKR